MEELAHSLYPIYYRYSGVFLYPGKTLVLRTTRFSSSPGVELITDQTRSPPLAPGVSPASEPLSELGVLFKERRRPRRQFLTLCFAGPKDIPLLSPSVPSCIVRQVFSRFSPVLHMSNVAMGCVYLGFFYWL